MHATIPIALVGTALLLANPTVSARASTFASGVAPHHLVAEPLIAAFYRAMAGFDTPDTIVLVGPDHFRAASVTGTPFATLAAEDGKQFGIAVDEPLLGMIRKGVPVTANTLRVAADHAISVHLPFIRKHFPATKVVPILIGHRATRASLDALATSIASQRNAHVVVIASVDFSHYLPKTAAAFHDVKSARVLLDNQSDEFPSLEVDSWQSLYLARRYARLMSMEVPLLVGHGNSTDFVANSQSDSTTSYLSMMFVEAGPLPPVPVTPPAHSVLLLGDLMLDRKVKRLMDDRGERWPFAGVRQLLRGVDTVFANLEGPIVRRKQTGDAPQRFGFVPGTAELLAQMKVNLVSLANNHTLDQGEVGLTETGRHLRKARVGFVGNPSHCDADVSEVRHGMVFLAFNMVGRKVCDVADLARAVQRARARSPDPYIVVSIHWGSEYVKTHAWWQEELAHAMIDAGADLVVGHHPHVVQDVELYRGRLIFYSLGNFIFDQYFMAETQVGLAVGLTVSAEQGEWRLFPFRSEESQPRLMAAPEAETWLADLAQASSPELAASIRRGSIVLQRYRHP